MKKVLLALAVVLSFTMVGCDKKSDSATNTETKISVKEGEKIYAEADQDIYNYSVADVEELVDTLEDKQSKKMNDGAFSDVIDLYKKEYKHIIVPVMDNQDIYNVFFDSNNVFINYVYANPDMRICIEPIDYEGGENVDKTDIKKYTEQRYDVIFDKEQELPEDEQVNSAGVYTGYEYDTYIYVTKTVEFKNGKKKCVLQSKDSEKSETEYMLSFFEDNMLVKIFYYGSKDDTINLNTFKKLSFEKEELN